MNRCRALDSPSLQVKIPTRREIITIADCIGVSPSITSWPISNPIISTAGIVKLTVESIERFKIKKLQEADYEFEM